MDHVRLKKSALSERGLPVTEHFDVVCVIAGTPGTQVGVGRADCLLWFALCWTAVGHVWLGMGISLYVIDALQGWLQGRGQPCVDWQGDEVDRSHGGPSRSGGR